MPFCLMNAPPTCYATMNDLCRPHLRQFELVFFDDILFYSPSRAFNLEHLHTVLQLLQMDQLKVNKKKCAVDCLVVEYLSIVISTNRIAMDLSKVSSTLIGLPTVAQGGEGIYGANGLLLSFYERLWATSSTIDNPSKKASGGRILLEQQCPNSLSAYETHHHFCPSVSHSRFHTIFCYRMG